MAATSADLTGTPGAVVVTRGPGLASAVNGIAHAALDRLPVVVIADTVADARISHQRIDQGALGRSVAKAAVAVSGPPTAAGPSPRRSRRRRGRSSRTWTTARRTRGLTAGRRRAPRRMENGVEVQTLRAAEDMAARAGRAILAEAVAGARRPVLLLGTGAIPRTAAVRDALDGRADPGAGRHRPARQAGPGRQARRRVTADHGRAAAERGRSHRRAGRGRGRDGSRHGGTTRPGRSWSASRGRPCPAAGSPARPS